MKFLLHFKKLSIAFDIPFVLSLPMLFTALLLALWFCLVLIEKQYKETPHKAKSLCGVVLMFTHFILRVLIDHLQHNIRASRFKLSSPAFFNFTANHLLRQNIAITSFGSHCVISVRDSDNSRLKRNILPRDFVRISRSVLFFVMILCPD